MDTFYDQERARAWLDQYILAQVQSHTDAQYLTTFQLAACAISQHLEPRCYRMTTSSVEGLSEVELRIPGVICLKTLPPQLRPLNATGESHVRKLRQFVKLTGLQSALFEGMKTNLSDIASLFRAAVSPTTLQKFEFKPWDGDFSIDVHTRYFTDRRQAPTLKHELIPDDVDPHPYLDVVRGGLFIYCHENRVEYCRKTAVGDVIQYPPINPGSFSVGDIVEAGVAFIAYPVGSKEYVLKIALRSLSMLSSEFCQDADKKRLKFLVQPTTLATPNSNKHC